MTKRAEGGGGAWPVGVRETPSESRERNRELPHHSLTNPPGGSRLTSNRRAGSSRPHMLGQFDLRRVGRSVDRFAVFSVTRAAWLFQCLG